MNLITLTVSGAIMGTLLPGVMLMSIAPYVASIRANNFAEAETSAVTYSTLAQNKYTLPEIPDNCEVELIEDRTYNITCAVGQEKYREEVTRAFSLLDEVANSLTVTSDDDLDGFDDVTGMPTHYFQCYSGWKGSSEDTLKNNCELGGPYVIPAYQHLYSNNEEVSE